ncbi:sushi, von Willebrand factor type A, EGF and pentraxin domain-containing protein 1 isoform X5, partial [Silurus meridionalis]
TFHDGATVKFKCSTGYMPVGASASRSITCTGAQWSYLELQCKVITCLKPPTITNGLFNPLKVLYIYGERVTYNCLEGFKLYGSPTISCSDDGKFETSLPECREIFCDPPYIRNAVIYETSRSPAYRYQTSIKISCNKGYRLEGSEYMTCGNDGWTPTLPRCVVITCLEPDHITNGQFIPLKALYKYGETVIYNCVEGFKLYGSPTISCSDNGMFETSLPECREIFCDPPSIQNAVIDETSRSPAYRYQTSIKIRCNPGYRIMGSEYMTCGNDGWTPALPRCVEMTCDAPRINNAVIVSRRYTVFTERYRYGAFIQLRCNKGYRMEGSDRLKCEENGWNPPPPKCSGNND